MVRKIKAKLVLRLRSEGLTGRQIAAQGMSRTSVAMVLDAADREGIGWDDVAARLGAVAARLRMIRCQRQLKAQQTLRDDLAATSKRAALARKRLKPLADAIAKRSNGVVSIPPTKSLWRMAQLAGCAEASLDSDDTPYEAPPSSPVGAS